MHPLQIHGYSHGSRAEIRDRACLKAQVKTHTHLCVTLDKNCPQSTLPVPIAIELVVRGSSIPLPQPCSCGY